MVTLGSNTVGDWEPRMQTESRELARLLQEYEKSPTKQKEQTVEKKFNEIYQKMLVVHKEHLKETKAKLGSLAEETLKEIAD
jgi:hypothetical protein